MTIFISAALIPVVWVLIQHFITGPFEKLLTTRFPGKISEQLAKKRFE